MFELLASSHAKEPYAIRRMLTEGAVRAADKRAQFVGLAAYEEAGGVIMRDLFLGDDGGWLQDVGLVDMMVAEKLREEADAIGAEGWKWVEVAPDFPYGHTFGQRQLRGGELRAQAPVARAQVQHPPAAVQRAREFRQVGGRRSGVLGHQPPDLVVVARCQAQVAYAA